MRGLYALAVVSAVTLGGCSTISSWWTSTSREYKPAPPSDLRSRLDRDGREPNNKVDHFAVLIGANTELRHRGNLSMAYQVLLEQGYEREKIYVLDSEGETPFFPLTEVTSREAVIQLFDYLSHVVEPQDTLLVYVTGHGRRIRATEDDGGEAKTLGVSTLVLNPGEELPQSEFFTLLGSVKPGVGIAFFDQCYWGQFSDANLCNYVTITTSDAEDTSYGVSFPRAFWGAFRKGKEQLSVLGAFKDAMVEDRATRLGMNRPRIAHGCVHPDDVLLLGAYRNNREIDQSRSLAASE